MKSNHTLSIIGAGGHAKVVVDAHQKAHPQASLKIFDQKQSQHTLLGLPIATYDLDKLQGWPVHVAIGDNIIRGRVCGELQAANLELGVVIHPFAEVSPHATLGPGCFIAAGAIIGPDAMIGQGVIVNHHAVIDHECVIESFAHIAPGAVLGGNITVGAYTLIGSGSTILPNLHIGAHAVVGSGAVVTRGVQTDTTVIGIPAKSI